MRYMLFGSGDYYGRYKKWFIDEEVIALIDNSKEKQGMYIDNHIVISPAEAANQLFDAIIILSFYVKSMKSQLVELGVDENKIYHFFQLHDLFGDCYTRKELKVYDKWGGIGYASEYTNSNRSKIVMFSHDLNLGGPALALMNAAIYLKSIGKDVVFVSMIDGPLADRLVKKGIEVVVDENLQIQTMKESVWQGDYQLIICNTISFYLFLSERNNTIPVIWWLHDSRFFYDGVDKERLQRIDLCNLKCVSVGPVPKNAMREFVPEIQIENLIYGTEEVEVFPHKKDYTINKVKFLIAGYIEYRKGQDILVDAIKNLTSNVLEQCEFIFVGQNTSMMARDLMEQTKPIEQIKFIGTVGREDMHRLMEEMDVLVCPSREDPMPTVCAEAMMHSKTCILSDATGTSAFITHKEDGLLFESQNVMQLKDCIVWCTENNGKLVEIGNNARKIYDSYFSYKVFKRKLSEMI